MPRRSSGLLPYRRSGDGTLELFLVHPGGPLWATRDEHAWSVAKGEYDEGDDALAAAEREFTEEIGVAPPAGRRTDLGEIRQAGGKFVTVWAIEAPRFEIDRVVSNQFELEWPPKSGHRRHFPEVDRAEWMTEAAARRRLVKGQVALLDRLLDRLQDGAPRPDGR